MKHVVIVVVMDAGVANVAKSSPDFYRKLVIRMDANPLVDGMR